MSASSYFLEVGREAVCPHKLWDDMMHSSATELASWTIYVGHFGGLLPLWLRKSMRVVTMMREPIARTISHIKHVQRDTSHPLHAVAAGLTPEQYCQEQTLRESVENLQSRYIAGLYGTQAMLALSENGNAASQLAFERGLYALERNERLADTAMLALDGMQAVGVTERHRDSLLVFAQCLNLTPPAGDFTENAAPLLQSMNVSSRDVEAISQITEVDQAVYAHATRLLEQQLVSLPSSSGAT